MLPTQGGILLQGGTPLVPAAQRPSRTYRADFAAGRIDGFTDGREAMEQAIYQILHTERFAWPIYSWNYGAELGRLTGRSVRVAQGELPRLLREALTQDARITGVRDVTVTQSWCTLPPRPCSATWMRRPPSGWERSEGAPRRSRPGNVGNGQDGPGLVSWRGPKENRERRRYHVWRKEGKQVHKYHM